MARRRKDADNRRAVTVVLIVAALLLLGALGFGVYFLINMWQSDATAESVTVPDIAGMSRVDAEAALRAAELLPKRARSDYHETVPVDQVYNQDPEAGQVVRPGRQVRYYISLGRATFTVPNLVGESVDTAPAILRKSGLRLGNVKRVYTRLRPSGRIMNQTPKGGDQYTSPIQVDLIVADSTNLPKVVMPSLNGLQLATAEELLTRPDVNLQLAVVEYLASDLVAPATVVSQKPEPGAEIDMGGRVQLGVAIPTLLKAQPAKQLRLRIRIPDGPDKQLVRVVVNDALGEKTDYRGEHGPGEVVERTIDVEGEARVRIYIIDDKNPWREERL